MYKYAVLSYHPRPNGECINFGFIAWAGEHGYKARFLSDWTRLESFGAYGSGQFLRKWISDHRDSFEQPHTGDYFRMASEEWKNSIQCNVMGSLGPINNAMIIADIYLVED